MISEFHDLSEKISRLAELTQSLRRENADLRQANVYLAAENTAYIDCLNEAQRRIEALIAIMPGPEDEAPEDTDAVDSAAQTEATP